MALSVSVVNFSAGHSLRVVKVVGADRTFYLYSGTQIISEFEDAASNTYSTGTTPGAAAAEDQSLQLYQHSDHLTTRVTTDNQGQTASQQGHHPFGEEWYSTGTADPSVMRKFTSYNKDTEVSDAQMHYAVFREHSSRVGRFFMPDPVRGRVSSPQRLNRYSYTRNDPANRIDPKGLADESPWGDDPLPYEHDGDVFTIIDSFTTGNTYAGGTWSALSPSLCGWGSPLTPPFFPNSVHPLCDPAFLTSGGQNCWAQLRYRAVEDRNRNPSELLTHSSWCIRDAAGESRLHGGPKPPCEGLECFLPHVKLDMWETSGCEGQPWGPIFYGCDVVQRLRMEQQSWPNGTIKYWPQGPNSNTAARLIGERAGLSVSMPPGAAGW